MEKHTDSGYTIGNYGCVGGPYMCMALSDCMLPACTATLPVRTRRGLAAPSSSSQGIHLPSTILFLVLWPQGNFTLTIFIGRLSLSGFGSCMTKPVYPCCQRTCTDPEAVPQNAIAQMGTHYRQPSLNSCKLTNAAGPVPGHSVHTLSVPPSSPRNFR